jgi:hypothetical protein
MKAPSKYPNVTYPLDRSLLETTIEDINNEYIVHVFMNGLM